MLQRRVTQMELFMEIFIVFVLGIHVYLLGLQDRISKQLRVMSLHVFGLLEPWNVFFQRLFLVFPLSLLNTLLILQVSRSFPFLLDFMLLGFPFPLYPPPPVRPSSAAYVEECLQFRPSSPSPGASKGGGPTQGVWRAHRHSPMGGELADAQTAQLHLGRRSILLICFCTPATGLHHSREDQFQLFGPLFVASRESFCKQSSFTFGCFCCRCLNIVWITDWCDSLYPLSMFFSALTVKLMRVQGERIIPIDDESCFV